MPIYPLDPTIRAFFSGQNEPMEALPLRQIFVPGTGSVHFVDGTAYARRPTAQRIRPLIDDGFWVARPQFSAMPPQPAAAPIPLPNPQKPKPLTPLQLLDATVLLAGLAGLGLLLTPLAELGLLSLCFAVGYAHQRDWLQGLRWA